MKTLSTILAIVLLTSCARSITGVVTEVKGDTIIVKNKPFLIPNNTLKVGYPITLQPTINRKKVNSRQL